MKRFFLFRHAHHVTFREAGRRDAMLLPLTVPAYEEMTARAIIACADAVIVDRRRKLFYLAKRAAKPAQEWWVIGGRVHNGEKPMDAVRRTFRRETGLALPERRFRMLRHFGDYVWKDRQQFPQERGGHNWAVTLCIELSRTERDQAAASLEQREYFRGTGLQPFDRARLVQEDVHPAIIRMYDEIFPKRRAAR